MLNGDLFVPGVVDKLVGNLQKYDGDNGTFVVTCLYVFFVASDF